MSRNAGSAETEMVCFRALPGERERYRLAARARGVPLSHWIRETLNREVVDLARSAEYLSELEASLDLSEAQA